MNMDNTGFSVYYKDGVQHLAHPDWLHTLCNQPTSDMALFPGMDLGKVAPCQECNGVAEQRQDYAHWKQGTSAIESVFKYSAWSAAFAIFAKYSKDDIDHISAEHDIIYAGPNPDVVSEDDKEQLEQLRWHVSDDLECFYHYT